MNARKHITPLLAALMALLILLSPSTLLAMPATALPSQGQQGASSAAPVADATAITYQIAQVEAWAFDDIDIKRGTTDDVIADPIWKSNFDANGEVISPPERDDPIADIITPDGWFTYEYTIGYWSDPPVPPTWVPTVQYKWKIKGSGEKSDGFEEQDGWTHGFTVTLPDEVGKYTLEVTLKIYREDELLRTEKRDHTLYVLLDSPFDVPEWSTTWKTDEPRTAWLDVATSWASGQSTEMGILDALNSSVYDNPFGWTYMGGIEDAVYLIEHQEGDGNCYTFRDVWRLLAAGLGIKTDKVEYAPSGVFVFLTSTRPALDGNASAHTLNMGTGVHDRWKFSNHEMGVYEDEDGTFHFYDPTFGLKGLGSTEADLEGNVFCKVYGSGITCDSNNKCACEVLSLPHTEVLAWRTGGEVPYWSEWAYEPMESKQLKQAVLAGLVALLPSGDDKVDKRIGEAIIHINNSLASGWEDGSHLTEEGKKVFDEEEKALDDLTKIKNPSKAILDAIDLLVLVDATLAKTAIDDAISAGGDTKEITKAQEEMAKAQEELDKGKPDKAIEHYRKAWEHAQKALEKLP